MPFFIFRALTKATFFFAVALFACSCSTVKTAKLMKRGEVDREDFKVEVPFTRQLDLILVTVNIGGKDRKFIFDTGAPNLIDQSLVTELNLKSAAKRRVGDSQGNKQQLGFIEVPEIRVGDVTFSRTGAVVADLKNAPNIGCMDADGLLGANVMRHAVWEIDFERNVITFTNDKSKLIIPGDAAVVAFDPAITGTPTIDIRLGDYTDRNVTVDFGSNGGYSTTHNALDALTKAGTIDALTYAVGRNKSGLYGAATEGSDTTFYAEAPITIGNAPAETVLIDFEDGNSKLLGLKFFRNRRTILDWGKNEMTLIRRAEGYEKQTLEGFGFSPAYDGMQLTIGFLRDGSEAKRAGLKLGDRILEVDRRSFRDAVPEDVWCDVILNDLIPKDWSEVRIVVLSDGEEKTVTLRNPTPER